MTVFKENLDNLLDRARDLEYAALGEVHDRYYPEVFRYVRYRLDDEQVCEDIASEVFLRLLNALHKRKGPNTNLRGWLLGTASHLINDHLRHHYKRKTDNLDENLEENLIADDSLEPNWDDSWRQQQVRKAVQKLTTEQQHVIALRFSENRSLDETAKVIGKTVTAVKALQFRALASLRRFLDDGQL